MNIPRLEGYKRQEVLKKSWAYLLDNFHKFSQDNRIKISLTLCARDIPTQLSGELKGLESKIIIIKNQLQGQNAGLRDKSQGVPR